MTIDMFGMPRPKYFTMGAEMYGDRIFASLDTGLKPGQGRSYQNGNAGVMLLNARNMRRVHDECVWSAHKIVVIAVFTAARNRSTSCLFLSCVLLKVRGVDFLGNERGRCGAPLRQIRARRPGRAEHVLS